MPSTKQGFIVTNTSGKVYTAVMTNQSYYVSFTAKYTIRVPIGTSEIYFPGAVQQKHRL